jgi:hypothetical protein
MAIIDTFYSGCDNVELLLDLYEGVLRFVIVFKEGHEASGLSYHGWASFFPFCVLYLFPTLPSLHFF